MLDTLDADALGLVLAHLGADDLAHVAAACASLRRKVLAAEHLWSQLLGGPQLFADVAVRAPPRLPSAAAATPNSPPRTAAEALVVRVLAVRAAALANWRSASPSVSEYVLEPTGERAGMVSALALDDCTLAAGGSDHCVRVWCLQTRALQLTLRGHSGAVRCLLLRAARHELFSGAWDKTVRQWDLRTGTCVREFARVHERCVMALAFASKHVLVSAGGEGRVAWTDLRATPEWTQPPPQRRFARTRRYESPVLALEVTRESTRAAFADGTLRVWRTQLEPARAARGLGERLAGGGSSGEDNDGGERGSAADAEWLVSVSQITLPPPPPPSSRPRGVQQTLPNGQPLPAEMLALYAEYADPSCYVAAELHAGLNSQPPTLALCSHQELVLANPEPLLPASRRPPISASARLEEHTSVEPKPRRRLTASARLDCAMAGACVTLLPEAGIALLGRRSTVLPGLAPGAVPGCIGACLLLADARPGGQSIRLALVSSPVSLAARWDVVVVGTQRGRIHVFDFTGREGSQSGALQPTGASEELPRASRLRAKLLQSALGSALGGGAVGCAVLAVLAVLASAAASLALLGLGH